MKNLFKILIFSLFSTLAAGPEPITLSISLENVEAMALPLDNDSIKEFFKNHAAPYAPGAFPYINIQNINYHGNAQGLLALIILIGIINITPTMLSIALEDPHHSLRNDIQTKTQPIFITITNNSDKNIEVPLDYLKGLEGQMLNKINFLKSLPRRSYIDASSTTIALSIWAAPIAWLLFTAVQQEGRQTLYDDRFKWTAVGTALAAATTLTCFINWSLKETSRAYQSILNSVAVIKSEKNDRASNPLDSCYTIKPGEIFRDLVFVKKDADLSHLGINL